jgi:hypothetical protein
MKRMRKAVSPIGSLTGLFPPRVTDLPKGWRHFSTAAKVEHLLSMDLTRAAEI